MLTQLSGTSGLAYNSTPPPISGLILSVIAQRLGAMTTGYTLGVVLFGSFAFGILESSRLCQQPSQRSESWTQTEL
jgi:hypothetical protein